MIGGVKECGGTDEKEWTVLVNGGGAEEDHESAEEDGAENTVEKNTIDCLLVINLS